MKEAIYTIPVNDAVNGEKGCPLCRMAHKLEEDYLDRALGGAMMEPDEREKTNARGFCPRHAEKLLARQQALPYALVLDTHLIELSKILGKTLPFSDHVDVSAVQKRLSEVEASCHICRQVDEMFEKYIGTLFFLWKKDEDFRTRLLTGDGFCIQHFLLLLRQGASHLPKPLRGDFFERLCAYERKALEKLSGDVHWFCQKFNYQNEDKPWGDSKDAVARAVRFLGGEAD